MFLIDREKVRAMTCENSATGITRVVSPQCLGRRVEVLLTVEYDDWDRSGQGAPDTLRLCRECAQRVKQDAERHGYTTTSRDLTEQEVQPWKRRAGWA